MDDIRSYKYHRSYWLIHQFFIIDSKLRKTFRTGLHCGFVTIITASLLILITFYSILSLTWVKSDEETFQVLQEGVDKTVPRKKSIASIKPAYNCIHKHLQQTDVFQAKTGKMLRKEHLELEILNSRITCINKLLSQEERWTKKRT